jgi:hypothetical protein
MLQVLEDKRLEVTLYRRGRRTCLVFWRFLDIKLKSVLAFLARRSGSDRNLINDNLPLKSGVGVKR